MIHEFSRIGKLKSVREDMARLAQEEEELTTPLLTNIANIQVMLGWFFELSGYSEGTDARKMKADHKKKFIFIILYFYSPSTLVSGQIVNGVRDELSKVLGYKSPTGVSNYIGTLVSTYNIYKDYMNDVDRIFLEVQKRLIEEGMLSH